MKTVSTIPALHNGARMETEVLPVSASVLGFSSSLQGTDLDDWSLQRSRDTTDFQNLRRAADEIKTTDTPVAFPTETVYGLGADATRSEAVQGIYKAKQRPSDNPLIVHIHSLRQLRGILRPESAAAPATKRLGDVKQDESSKNNSTAQEANLHDPIPSIYRPLIERFWPGPLTLIMPNPKGSKLASEVTAGLQTFGVRMPQSPHALALIRLADRPLAAPSANASTKPSPTTAEHVLHDLNGRIKTIIDGGPCQVGVESTVVDVLCDPPAILRPGGISIEQIKACQGWQDVLVGYKDTSQAVLGPRAPGMKYKHYSPKAPVILAESSQPLPTINAIRSRCGQVESIGVIRTLRWSATDTLSIVRHQKQEQSPDKAMDGQWSNHGTQSTEVDMRIQRLTLDFDEEGQHLTVWDVGLGSDAKHIARGLFAALRELDLKDVDAILVEGISESHGTLAAAIMNRLRKAAIPAN